MGSAGDVGSWGGRLQLLFFCHARDQPEELGLCKQREQRFAGSLPGFLVGLACLAGSAFWSPGLGYSDE